MKVQGSVRSSDNMAVKFIQLTFDNYGVETLYVDYPNKHIVCFSTQVGCSNECKFCYNGLYGKFHRNLTIDELIEQVDNVVCSLDRDKPLLLSAMGVGDVGGNLANFVDAVRILHDRYQDRDVRFALSTVGTNLDVFDTVKRLLNEGIRCKVQVSLHSGNDFTRHELMRYCPSLNLLLDRIRACYIPVEFNIVLFEGINDSDADALEVYSLLKAYDLLNVATVKINRYNPVKGCVYKQSSRVAEYRASLLGAGLDSEYYETNGSDIDGACGQMLGGVKKC